MNYLKYLALGLFFFVALTILPKWKTQRAPLRLGSALENSALRKAYEEEMLKDPSTGQVPEGYRIRELAYSRAMNAQLAKTEGEEWTQRGPWNVGGRTRALAMDVTDSDILVAASVSGRIYRSTDLGQSWKPTLGLDQHPGIVSIAQDIRPGHENTWYALGGEASGASQSAPSAFFLGDGAYISTDSAQSWNLLSSTSGGTPTSYSQFFQTGWRIMPSPKTSQDILYIASVYGIQVSYNGGGTWKFALGNFSNPSNYYTDMDISPSGVVYAGLSSDDPATKGIYRSDDDSVFVDITPTQYINNYGRIVMDVNPNNENEVYFLVYMDDSLGNPVAVQTSNYKGEIEYISLLKYTYLSGNGTGSGGMWENLSPNLPVSGGGPFDKLNCQGGYDMLVKVQPQTGNVYLGGTNLYFSNDGFTSSQNTRMIGGYKPLTTLPFFGIYPNHHPDQHDVVFAPTDTTLILSASDGGVRMTQDVYASTVPWQNLNGGYFSSQYYTVTINRHISDDPYLLGGFQDNGNFVTNTTNIQHQWVMPFNGDGAYNYISADKSFYVMSIQLGKMIKAAVDAQGNLTAFERIDPIGADEDDYLFINPIAVDPNNEDILYVPAGQKLFRQDSLTSIAYQSNYDSTSQGWTQIFDSLSIYVDYITAIAVSKFPANTVYLGTNKGRVFKVINAHSANPQVQDLYKPNLPTAYVSSIAVDEKDGSKVLISYSNYNAHSIFYTEDGGTNWDRAGGNLEKSTFGYPPSVRWVSIVDLPNGSKKYFAGTSIGLFSVDTMTADINPNLQPEWVREGAQTIGNAVVRHIAWRPTDGYVVVGTHGDGAFAKSFPDNDAISSHRSIQLEAYPNPAKTELSVKLPHADKLRSVHVFDVTGQLHRSFISPQIYDNTLKMDVRGLPQSMYFAQLITESGQRYTVYFHKE